MASPPSNKPPPRLPRSWPAVVLLGLSLLTAPTLSILASLQRSTTVGSHNRNAEVARLLPWPDLAIASGARHLRFLSLEEPAAAFADNPASLDTDPAGGSIAPPREVWMEHAIQH